MDESRPLRAVRPFGPDLSGSSTITDQSGPYYGVVTVRVIGAGEALRVSIYRNLMPPSV